MHPQRPRHMVEYARACLGALAEQGLGAGISLGGALGLSYYLEYRATHDVDAWWGSSAGDAERRRIVALLRETLSRFGGTRVRSWGDVVSVELEIAGRVVFSFQVASRTAQLEESRQAP